MNSRDNFLDFELHLSQVPIAIIFIFLETSIAKIFIFELSKKVILNLIFTSMLNQSTCATLTLLSLKTEIYAKKLLLCFLI